MKIQAVQETLQGFCKTKYYLLSANIALVFFLIALSLFGVLPLGRGDFLFFSLLALALALYRPGWSFLLFIGAISIENISVSPPEWGIAIRPYQFLGALTLIALAVRFLGGRLAYKPIPWSRQDILLCFIGVSSAATALMSLQKIANIKQAAIFFSFLGLYFLIRYYIQDLHDLKKVIPFFLSAALIVTVYGIWQNIQFARGLFSFEVMPGRPNSTFAEPDWLGMYLVLLLSLLYSLLFYLYKNSDTYYLAEIKNQKLKIKMTNQNVKIICTYGFLLLVLTLIILTVSRSAWLAAFIVTVSFLVVVFTKLKWNPAYWQWREGGAYVLKIFCVFGVSLFLVYAFKLTSFHLFNRAQSTGSGLQLITLSCPGNQDIAYPREVKNLEEVTRYGCRHINLEDIKKEKELGNAIVEVLRPDPNVSIRSALYQKSWNEIKMHPIMGIGWGSIGEVLGKDGQGNSFNTSNIFLETWLGAGMAGLIAFIGVWIVIFIKAMFCFLQRDNQAANSWGLFLILGSEAFLITNLFNAGMFLGILFLFFAVSNINTDEHRN